MKLHKSTTILINVALVLLIIILAKSFIGFPKNANAASPGEYKVVHTNLVQVETMLNNLTKEGWHFFTWGLWTPGPNVSLVFER
jgi:flagellar basal body-associated protein FliL